MSSLDRLEALRHRNKDLLNQLNEQRGKLERLRGCSQSGEREDEPEERREREPEERREREPEERREREPAERREREPEERREREPEERREREPEERREREPAEVVIQTDGDPAPARAALAKPTVTFADECENQTRVQGNGSRPCLTSKHSRETADRRPTTASDHFKNSDRPSQVHNRLRDTRPPSTKSCLRSQSEEQREEWSRVTSPVDGCEEICASDRRHLQPLLGYDWIAGVLDTEDSLIERSDAFYNDLRMFRSLNRDECVHSSQVEFSEESHSVPPPLTGSDDPEANVDTHQCTFSYRINSRLFPVPLHSQECCPVCKKHKSSHPHTTAEPALIRVSIPRSTLLPSYKYKAHRRCSFDPSDSLGLPSHCLSGWSNKGQSTLPPPSSLDLRSSLDKKSSTELLLEDIPESKKSSNQVCDQISDVSCLARHKFQHFSPKRKLGGKSSPMY
ncbi:migration and invasion-inhibitory protein [Labrus mixtus]|uniref:migration and invasion-inhibitory protein n=1 Tax=Labrus mixtus TaxID=508554 RepID=UPI0029C00450|nr:migration and invasion-inhibitory protein [Labrus mixtus]